MKEGFPIPVRMIDTKFNEVIDEYPTIDQCAYDNYIPVSTIRAALKSNQVTKTGYRFERINKTK